MPVVGLTMGTQLRDGNVGRMGMVQVTINPASVAANVVSEQTFPVSGLEVGDHVVAIKPTLTPGLALAHARVSADSTLALTFVNPTAGAVDAPAEVYRILWFRPEIGDPSTLPGAVQV